MDIKAELLLTDIEIRDAMNKPFPSNESPWSLVDVSKSDEEIAKAQATKVVTGVFERIKEMATFTYISDTAVSGVMFLQLGEKEFQSLKQELLDEIGGEK